VSLSLPPSLVAELRAVATDNDRSLSAEARLALRAWLARTEKAA
jgi:plasmid stability protein